MELSYEFSMMRAHPWMAAKIKSARPYIRPKSVGRKGESDVISQQYVIAKQETNGSLHLISYPSPHNPVSSTHVLRRLTKCLVIDEAAPRASAHDKAHIGHHVLQELPPFPIRHKIGGSCNDARDVCAGHGMQGMKRDGVDEARIDR